MRITNRLALAITMLAFALMNGMLFSLPAAQAASEPGRPHTPGSPGHPHIHILPAAHALDKHALASDLSQNLLYNGGQVMHTTSTTYAVFWEPPTLQDRSSTQVSPTYNSLIERYFNDIGSSGLYGNNTQYNDTTAHISNSSTLGGIYIDSSPYPTSACSDSMTPSDCLTDAQIQAEVSKAMSTNNWTGGLTHMFFVFTSLGEGSCFDTSSTSCAFTEYCAYHSYFGDPNNSIIYANMPYTGTSLNSCGVGTTPNNDYDADSTINVTSHEHMEAVTDPLLNAWYDSTGNEIGDKCAWNFGNVSLDSGAANVQWNTDYYIVQQEWSNAISGCTLTAPSTQQNGVLYTGSNDHFVYALDINNGALLWRYKTGWAVVSSPVVVNGVVYVGSQDHYIYALDASRGALLWRTKTGGSVNDSPVVANSIVYIGSADGNLYALNTANGSVAWKYQTHSAISSMPAVGNSAVYITTSRGMLIALDAMRGTALWHVQFSRTALSSPVIAGTVVYVGTSSGYIMALNAGNNGVKLWSAHIKTSLASTPTIANNVLYIGGGNGFLYALDITRAGAQLWSYRTRSAITTQAFVANSAIYFGVKGNYLDALNSAQGTYSWHYRTGSVLFATPDMVNGTVYFTCTDRYIYAVDATSGRLNWHARTGGPIYSSPTVV